MSLPAAILIALLLCAPSARAEEPLPAWVSYAALVGGHAADLWTTVPPIRSGLAQEANPIMGRALGRVVATKAIGVGVVALIMHAYQAHGHPKMATFLGVLSGSAGAGAAVHNYAITH